MESAQFKLYLWTVSIVGVALCLFSVWQIPTYQPLTTFLLLAVLCVISAALSTSLPINEQSGITYTIGPAISLAAIPTFGAFGATLLAVLFNIIIWAIKPANRQTWKKSGRQLAFNVGMIALSLIAAGWVYEQTLFPHPFLAWVAAVVVYEEVNLWLLIIVLRLQNGKKIKPLKMWKSERWASQLYLPLLILGSGTLAFALNQYDIFGVLILALPLLLSFYAFQLYLREMRSHLANLESIVDERTQALTKINREKDAFLAILTHDMITPLTSIQMYGEAIQADPTLPARQPETIQFMLRSQKTLFDMAHNILDLERLSAGKALSMQKVRCDLGSLIEDAVGVIQPEAQEKTVTIRVSIEDAPLHVLADSQQMERILLNLLSNAIKYTPVDGSISILARPLSDSCVEFSISDTGYGIPKKELPHIFERFRRVHQMKDKANGTGLGLAITKALVEEHGGTIAVFSQENKGTTFTVSLPS